MAAMPKALTGAGVYMCVCVGGSAFVLFCFIFPVIPSEISKIGIIILM